MSYLKRLFLCTVNIKCLKIYGKLTVMHYNVFFIFKAILFFSILYATWHTAINRIIFNVLIFVNISPFVDKNKNKKLLGSLYLNNLEKKYLKTLKIKKINNTKPRVINLKNGKLLLNLDTVRYYHQSLVNNDGCLFKETKKKQN